jgi:hypothetical protein
MSYNLDQQTKKTARVRRLFVAALVFVCAFGAATYAAAQTVTPPPTPTAITPPAGNTAYAVGHAFGSQGYVCLPDQINGGTSWTVNPARPEATLFVNVFGQSVQIITHFASIDANPNGNAPNPVPLGGNATWQSSFDTSKVWAAVPSPQKDHTVVAGTDASCPNTGAIPCLLLQSVGNQQGPTGGKFLAQATFVQRLNTKGGSAPTTACTVGQTQLQGYTADYFFFRADQ